MVLTGDLHPVRDGTGIVGLRNGLKLVAGSKKITGNWAFDVTNLYLFGTHIG